MYFDITNKQTNKPTNSNNKENKENKENGDTLC